MIMTRNVFATFALGIALAVPHLAFAQYGGQGLGSALSSSPMSHQSSVKAGVDDIATNAAQETPFKIIKDVKLGLKDADPTVRVSELEKLRNLQDPEVNQILITSLSDPDARVKIKAIDILGAREANDAVPPMMQDLGEVQDERGRGTAVFALGEIGSDKAVPLLNAVVAQDQSPMVQRLAKEALQKVSGEMPTERAKTIAANTKGGNVPTDQKLAKLREMDKKMSDLER